MLSNFHGARMCFVISAVLYLPTGYFTDAGTPDKMLQVFVAWLTCATAAAGIHEQAVKPLVSPWQR